MIPSLNSSLPYHYIVRLDLTSGQPGSGVSIAIKRGLQYKTLTDVCLSKIVEQATPNSLFVYIAAYCPA